MQLVPDTAVHAAKRGVLLAVLVVAFFAILGGLFGCAKGPVADPCKINPTKTNAAGEWVEQDDEPMDDDPCDSDDLFGDDDHRTPAVVKLPESKPKVTPAKPQVPTGGRTKKF